MPCVRFVVLATVATLVALPVRAAEPGLATPEDGNWLDASREGVRSTSEWLARGVNGWFGDRPFEDGGSVSNGRLKISTLWRRDNGVKVNVRFRARFELPNLHDRAYFFFGRENKDKLLRDTPQAFTREQQLIRENQREDDTFFAGLGAQLLDDVDFRLGVRSSDFLYAQARYTQDWQLGEAAGLHFRETGFASLRKGVGATTALDFDYALSPSLTFRWLNGATITTKTDGWDWGSSVGLYRQFSHERLLSLELLASGNTDSPVDVSEYGVRAKWYQPIYRDWLFAEFIVGHFWPREDRDLHRDRSWAAGLGLEMRF